MFQQNKQLDWDGMQKSELRSWYFVSKVMATIIPGNFPYYTYRELQLQIQEDPSFEKKE